MGKAHAQKKVRDQKRPDKNWSLHPRQTHATETAYNNIFLKKVKNKTNS